MMRVGERNTKFQLYRKKSTRQLSVIKLNRKDIFSSLAERTSLGSQTLGSSRKDQPKQGGAQQNAQQ